MLQLFPKPAPHSISVGQTIIQINKKLFTPHVLFVSKAGCLK
jgi:hypothetical protein